VSDPICNICGEPKSAHVPTEKGPLTHPREARGEGTYKLVQHGGYSDAFFPGEEGYAWPDRWEFVPSKGSHTDHETVDNHGVKP